MSSLIHGLVSLDVQRGPWLSLLTSTCSIILQLFFHYYRAAQHSLTFYMSINVEHDDVIKWNHFPRYWPFVGGIHRSPVNSSHKSQWRGALMFPLICAWINGWANNREVGDMRRRRTHYYVTVMYMSGYIFSSIELTSPLVLVTR